MSIKRALGLMMIVVPILAVVPVSLYMGQGLALLFALGCWCWGVAVGWLLLDE